jgi:dimeric dUTPase (all-alpha-NTP-PPase superfamily)
MLVKVPLFGSWLSQTAELQFKSYGYSPMHEGDFEVWITYIREQTLAAFVELGEFVQDLKWKPWGKLKAFPTISERAHAIEEIVDILHFIGNLLYALGVTDEELSREYANKMEVNRSRMAQGGHHDRSHAVVKDSAQVRKV